MILSLHYLFCEEVNIVVFSEVVSIWKEVFGLAHFLPPFPDIYILILLFAIPSSLTGISEIQTTIWPWHADSEFFYHLETWDNWLVLSVTKSQNFVIETMNKMSIGIILSLFSKMKYL